MKKRGLNIKLKLSNSWLYTLITLGILIIVAIRIYAIDKSGAWHSVNEIDFREGGIEGNLIIDGKVGIGTTEPGAPLDIVSGTGETILIGRANGKATIKASTDGSGHLIMDSNNAYLSLNHYTNDNVVLAYGGGNIGIGTTSSSAKLDVDGTIIGNFL